MFPFSISINVWIKTAIKWNNLDQWLGSSKSVREWATNGNVSIKINKKYSQDESANCIFFPYDILVSPSKRLSIASNSMWSLSCCVTRIPLFQWTTFYWGPCDSIVFHCRALCLRLYSNVCLLSVCLGLNWLLLGFCYCNCNFILSIYYILWQRLHLLMW